MRSQDYKNIISRIVHNLIMRRFPGLEKKHIREVSRQIAVHIHARMYGANVDNVDSPIWQDRTRCQSVSKIDAIEILKQCGEIENVKICDGIKFD